MQILGHLFKYIRDNVFKCCLSRLFPWTSGLPCDPASPAKLGISANGRLGAKGPQSCISGDTSDQDAGLEGQSYSGGIQVRGFVGGQSFFCVSP